MVNQLPSIEEARKRQEIRQRNAIRNFCLSLLAVSVATLLLVHYTDYFERFPSLYVLPLFAAAFCFYRTKMHLFFTPKEVVGSVRSIEAYEVARRARASGTLARSILGVELRIVVDLEDGSSVVKSFPGGPVFEELRIGDRVALLRFLVWPVRPEA